MATPPYRRASPVAVLLPVVFMLAFLAGCTREPEAPLRVGTNVWPGYEPFYLARELGCYPQGSVKLVEYSSASEVMQAFRNGAIDAAALTLDEALLLAETTSDVSVVLVLDVSNGADVVLARPGLTGLRDLKGQRVGLETTALGAYVLTRALQTVGMTPADVRTVHLDVFQHERVFREGRIDAVVTFEPARTRLLAAGARQLFDSSMIPGEIVDVLVVRRTFAAHHGAQTGRFVRGWFSALDFIHKDPARAAALMAGRERISAAEFQKALAGLHLSGLADNRSQLAGSPPAILFTARRLSRVMLANRLLERPPEMGPLFDDRFIEVSEP